MREKQLPKLLKVKLFFLVVLEQVLQPEKRLKFIFGEYHI